MSSDPAAETVLDSSGVLAVVRTEPGYELVVEALRAEPAPSISSVNLAEVVTKLADWGYAEPRIVTLLNSLNLRVVPFDAQQAHIAGMLRPATRSAGLSLGDRACIALAIRLHTRVLTMDAVWATLDLPVDVVVARP